MPAQVMTCVARDQCNHSQSSRNRNLNFSRASGTSNHMQSIRHSCAKSMWWGIALAVLTVVRAATTSCGKLGFSVRMPRCSGRDPRPHRDWPTNTATDDTVWGLVFVWGRVSCGVNYSGCVVFIYVYTRLRSVTRLSVRSVSLGCPC